MDFFDLVLIGIGVSMDAFSVAICKGLSVQKLEWKHILIVGLYFGFFQAIMPIIGHTAGSAFSKTIADLDHWVALILLALLGLQMIREALASEECPVGDFSYRVMVHLAVATSIDAMAVGITFAFLQVNLFLAALVIGLSTFSFSAVGVWIGNKFGQAFQKPAQLAGGAILILIGIKIFAEHSGII